MEASTKGPAWDTLRAALAELSAVASAESAPLVGLGKAYAKLTVAMVGVAAAAGHRSVRYEAAAKALDLKTKRSELSAFVEPPPP